jgi:nicotinate-nucleotide adenylyltransferase
VVGSVFSPRAGESDCLEHTGGHRIYFRETTLLDVAASRLRAWIREDRTVRYLIPEQVWEYVQENGLYANTRKD